MMIFVTILQLLAALVLIGIVLFQSGKSQGLSGTIGGIADSYMAKSKAKSLDAKLAKATKWVGAAFIDAGYQLHAGRRSVSKTRLKSVPKQMLRDTFFVSHGARR